MTILELLEIKSEREPYYLNWVIKKVPCKIDYLDDFIGHLKPLDTIVGARSPLDLSDHFCACSSSAISVNSGSEAW